MSFIANFLIAVLIASILLIFLEVLFAVADPMDEFPQDGPYYDRDSYVDEDEEPEPEPAEPQSEIEDWIP